MVCARDGGFGQPLEIFASCSGWDRRGEAAEWRGWVTLPNVETVMGSPHAPAGPHSAPASVEDLIARHTPTIEYALAVEAFLREDDDIKKAGKVDKSDPEMTVIHLAAVKGNRALMEKLAMCPKFLDDLNARTADKETPLHLAALMGNREIVEYLVSDEVIKKKLRGDAEDKLGQTAYEIAVELEWHDTQRALLGHDDVIRYLEERRFKSGVYGSGINAILVGAALIASITFAGWLQPPLGYQAYYRYPRNASMADAPPDVFEQYATIEEHLTVKVFWIANSLSFYCAIASILAGAAALVPRYSLNELAEVRRLKGAVYLTSFSLSWAVIFVVIAFTAAGFASLPPIIKYEVYMIVTMVLGVLVCLQGFVGARMSDPYALQKVIFLCDPSFYLSNVSKFFERFCEWLPWHCYESYESRKKKRLKQYHSAKAKDATGWCACLSCPSRKRQDSAGRRPQQASAGPGDPPV